MFEVCSASLCSPKAREYFYPDRDTEMVQGRVGLGDDKTIMLYARTSKRVGKHTFADAEVMMFPLVSWVLCEGRDL